MTEQSKLSFPDYRHQILERTNVEHMKYALRQVALRGFNPNEYRDYGHFHGALAKQISVLNSPYVWDCILTNLPKKDGISGRDLSESNNRFMGEVAVLTATGILMGYDKLSPAIAIIQEKHGQSPLREGVLGAMKELPEPVKHFEEVIQRTGYVFGDLSKSGSLEASLSQTMDTTTVNGFGALMDTGRIYGAEFSSQFGILAL